MQPQTLISILPLLYTLCSAVPIRGSAAIELSSRDVPSWPDFCGPKPTNGTAPKEITCVVPGMTSSGFDSFMSNLDPKYCTRVDDGIECNTLPTAAPKGKRNGVDGVIAFLPLPLDRMPLATHPPTANLRRRVIQVPESVVPIPKAFVVADKVKDFATLSDVVSSPGSKAGFDIDIHYGFKWRVSDNILSTVENPA